MVKGIATIIENLSQDMDGSISISALAD